MTQLTDEMIQSSLKGGVIVGIFFAVIFLTIGLIIMLRNVKKSRMLDQKEREGEAVAKADRTGIRIAVIVSSFLLVIGLCFCTLAVESSSTSKEYSVSQDVIVKKEYKRVHTGKNHSKEYYYFYFENLDKKKVTSGRYDKYEEGDLVLLVLDRKEKIQKIYNAAEYEYVGEYLK